MPNTRLEMTNDSANFRSGATGFAGAPTRLVPTERREGLDARFQVARLLDYLAHTGGEESVERITPTDRAELLSLAQESDAGLFGEALYHWARRQEDAGRLENAALVYGLLRHPGENGTEMLEAIPDGLRARASARMDAIEGRGAIGNRVEFLARRFIRETSNPVTLVGMAAGTFAFSSVRSVLLARTLASGRTVFGARALASSGAFLAEVPVFWGTTKGLNEILYPGTQAWDARTNLSELAGLGLTLGALKVSGALTGSAVGWAHRLNAAGQATRLAGLTGFSRRVAPQLGMLGGIMIGHRLEERVGLRRHVDGGTTLTDSLIMLLQFNVGGNLSRRMMGENFRAYTEVLDQRVNQRARLRPLELTRAPSPLAYLSAVYGSLFCVGCTPVDISGENLPLILGIGGATVAALAHHIRSTLRSRAADAFHALPRKTLDDLLAAAPRATGLSRAEVERVMTTVLRYGSPRPEESIDAQTLFKKVAVDFLRLPPIKRRGGFPLWVLHVVPFPEDPTARTGAITGMPLAYADRIRTWTRKNLELPDRWLATPEQISSRVDILTNNIALKFELPVDRAAKLVSEILRIESGDSAEQQGQLFKNEFNRYAAESNYDYHYMLTRQPAETILRLAGIEPSLPFLKQVIVQLAWDCRLPVPAYSMHSSHPFNHERNYDRFTDHDWQAVFRLRDAVKGPWRLPWEERPRLSDF